MATDDSVVTGLSGRYATALFELAEDGKALDEVANDLRALQTALDQSDDLVRLVRSPIVSRDDQQKAMDAVAAAMGLSSLTRRTVGLLAQKRRLFALGAIIRDYLKLLAAHRGETTAEVTSARQLTSQELEKLTATLKKVVGRDVAVEARVDADIMGGLVVRIGSRMLDSSIRSKLQRLEIAMKGAG